MTLQDLIQGTEKTDLTQIPVFINNQCVFDFKEGDGAVKLIHNEDCFGLEQVTLREIVDYATDCYFEHAATYVLSDITGEYVTSYSFDGTNLNLNY